MNKITLSLFSLLGGLSMQSQEPATAAPTPTANSANVLSLFSNAYTNEAVDTWRTDWSVADYSELQIAGDDVKKYSNLSFVGVETVGANLVDASGMVYLHIDVWTPNMTAFRIKLVDFGADGMYQGGDDSESEISFAPVLNGWNSYDIPLDYFTGLTAQAHLAQMIFAGDPAGTATLFIDNVYFSNMPLPDPEPTAAAPTPTFASTDVISLFSDAYTNVGVDTWRTDWSVAALEEVNIQGNAAKKYTALSFVGVETTGANLVDASGMTYFHVDAWTPNMTTFRIKLVDFGANGSYQGGDDSEFELSFTPTQLGWNSYHIPLSNFTGLAARAHLAQLIFSGNPAGAGELYIDNVYFTTQLLGLSSADQSVLKMYPNPTSGNLILQANRTIDQLEIFNFNGQQMLKMTPQNSEITFDVSFLAAGVYMVKITSATEVEFKKLVVK